MRAWHKGMLALSLAAAVAGCGQGRPQGAVAARAVAPAIRMVEGQPFMWGVSTAGYQWEGHDSASQWKAWEQAGHAPDQNVAAADGLNRHAEDLDLTAGMGCNAFRTSIEWSRIEPTEGVIDPAGVAFYHRLLDGIRARGLTPIVTLHHFTHPEWFAKKGGWEQEANVATFERYVAFCAREFGPKVQWWITFNEPNVYVAGGWLAAGLPPGRKSPLAAIGVAKRLGRAHAAAYRALHAQDPDAKVSFNWYTAEWALSGLMDAQEEDQALRATTHDDAMAAMAKDERSGQRTIDYTSFDYYCKLSLRDVLNLPRQDRWQAYPEGFYKALKRYHARYRLPILVAENGMATWEGLPRADGWTRANHLVAHVKAMQQAMREGVPVLGYVHWSITDNWEWGSFSPRFGLYRVECRQQEFTRIPTDGVPAYQGVIQAGGASPELQLRFPAPRADGSLPMPALPGPATLLGLPPR